MSHPSEERSSSRPNLNPVVLTHRRSSNSSNASFHSAVSHLEDNEGRCSCLYKCTRTVFLKCMGAFPNCMGAFLKCMGATNLNLVWFIVVLSCGAVLALSVAIKRPLDIDSRVINYFFVICMSLGSVWMWGAFTCRAPPCGCCIIGRKSDNQIPCYMIIALSFFCIGSCFISGVDFLLFMYAMTCQDKDLDQDVSVSRGVYNLTKFAYLLFQLHFFCRFSGKTFYRRCCTSFFILHIIAVNLTSWLYFIVVESVETTTKDDFKNCTKFNEIAGFVEAADIYLYPFNIEYMVMSSVLFLLLWFELEKKKRPQPENTVNHQPQNEDRQHVPRTRCSSLKNCCLKFKDTLLEMCGCRQNYVVQDNNNAKTMFFWKSAIFGYTVGIVVLTAYLVLIVLLAKEYIDQDSVKAYYAVRITLFLLLTLASLIGLGCLPKRGSHNKLHTRVDSILIMIGVSGCYVLTFFKITSAVSDEKQCHVRLIQNSTYRNHSILNANDNNQIHKDICPILGFYLADEVLSMLQFSLQAIFIVKALRRGQEQVSLTAVLSLSVVRNVSALLSLGNFGIWAMDTFELKDLTTVNDVEIAAYGANLWHILVHIVYPLCIFFRLHSAFCFFEIVINRFGINVQPRRQGYRYIRVFDEPSIQEGPSRRFRASSF